MMLLFLLFETLEIFLGVERDDDMMMQWMRDGWLQVLTITHQRDKNMASMSPNGPNNIGRSSRR